MINYYTLIELLNNEPIFVFLIFMFIRNIYLLIRYAKNVSSVKKLYDTKVNMDSNVYRRLFSYN